MREKILLLAIVLVTSISSLAQAPCVRHTEAAGGFSYCPPVGWSSETPKDGAKFNVFISNVNSQFVSNVNAREAVTSSSLEEFSAASIKGILSKIPVEGASIPKLVGWTDIESDSGLKGSRLVFETVYKNLLIRTITFIFDLPGKKVLFTCTGLESSKAVNDPIFDKMMMSLKKL